MKTKLVTENLSKYTMMSSANDMFDLVNPLNSLIKITHFSCHRVYKDNSRTHISTHPSFIDFYHKNKFYKLASTSLPFDSYESGYYIIDNVKTNDLKVIIDATTKLFDYYHPFVIIKKNAEYCEFFYFSTNLENYGANNFYLNNIELFEDFIFYFKSKACKLLNKIDAERFIYPQQKKYIEENPFYNNFNLDKNKFMEKIKLNSYKIDNINASVSHREIQCLSYIKKGYTNKAIASILDISPRTVESYINNLKLKLNKSSKLELVCFFEENIRRNF